MSDDIEEYGPNENPIRDGDRVYITEASGYMFSYPREGYSFRRVAGVNNDPEGVQVERVNPGGNREVVGVHPAPVEVWGEDVIRDFTSED